MSNDLLRSAELTVDDEDDHYGYRTGEVVLELDFVEGVEFDVDGEDGDGTIYIQYWDAEADHE